MRALTHSLPRSLSRSGTHLLNHSITPSLNLSLSLRCPSLSLSDSLCLSPCVSLSLSLCLSLSFSVSLCLSPSHSVSLCVCLSLSLSVSLSLSPSLSLESVFVCLSLSMSLSLSPNLCLSLSLSLSLSLFLSMELVFFSHSLVLPRVLFVCLFAADLATGLRDSVCTGSSETLHCSSVVPLRCCCPYTNACRSGVIACTRLAMSLTRAPWQSYEHGHTMVRLSRDFLDTYPPKSPLTPGCNRPSQTCLSAGALYPLQGFKSTCPTCVTSWASLRRQRKKSTSAAMSSLHRCVTQRTLVSNVSQTQSGACREALNCSAHASKPRSLAPDGSIG